MAGNGDASLSDPENREGGVASDSGGPHHGCGTVDSPALTLGSPSSIPVWMAQGSAEGWAGRSGAVGGAAPAAITGLDWPVATAPQAFQRRPSDLRRAVESDSAIPQGHESVARDD